MTDIVTFLRQWGLKVETKPGWENRGRPYTFSPKAIVCHHTASSRTSGNFASETIVTEGRSDLPGPLCQFLLGRDGTVKVIAAGYANHAGEGGPLAGMPRNMGNTYAYGIEAENDGIGEPWSKEQLNAYYRLCAALLARMKTKDVSRVIGHKEWSPGRKIDPTGINMNLFRQRVKDALAEGPSVKTVRLSRIKPGKRNIDVLRIKHRLKKRGYIKEETKLTNFFGGGFRAAYSKFQKDLGYSGHDANGIPGKGSLERLGFRVTN